eukprot:scaffold4643_cov174-Skeletonema_menzelii.AAC.8
MKLITFSLFAFASGFYIHPTHHIRSTTLTSRDDLRHQILFNHHLRETKLFHVKTPLLNRNDSNVEDADAFMAYQAQVSDVDVDIEMPGSPAFLSNKEADALFATLDREGKVHHIDERESENNTMRPPPDPKLTSWDGIKRQLMTNFGFDHQELAHINEVIEDKDTLSGLYKSMQLARQFEAACSKQYMEGKIRGFMHLDNGQ